MDESLLNGNGRKLEPEKKKKGHSLFIGLHEQARFEVDLSSLTKHAIILGATGSGKTVLAKVIVEEAALLGIPTFAIDPKGDIGNLAFKSATFDFSKWCGKEADALKISRADHAQALQRTYEEKAKEFGIRPSAAAEFSKIPVRIFTPKSSAGLAVGISPNLTAPDNFEQLLSSDVSAAADLLDLTSYNLLRLAGYGEEDRKEITFISALLENSWKAGKSLTTQELIREIESPPISSVGSMHVSDVLSDRERHSLATRINLLVSDPKLRSWSASAPFDFSSLFGSPPSVNVLDLRNIQSEQEKQLFVEIVLQQLFQWLIKQGSAQTLRYLLYFDEIAGYCPPVREPSSKKLLLLLIKQARAFGLGLVLASQNAVDLDYKVISNANVRFIGRLGAQRDIQRVSVGLELDSFAEREISRLRAGEFFCNVFDPKFRGVVRARWPLTYHRGPLENSEIAELVAEFREGSKNSSAKQMSLQSRSTAKEVKLEPIERQVTALPKKKKASSDPDIANSSDTQLASPDLSSSSTFVLLEKKYLPASIAEFIKLGSNVKSLKALSVETEEIYHPIFKLDVTVSEKSYSKQSLEKSAELCVLDGELTELPEGHSITASRSIPHAEIVNAQVKWKPEAMKVAQIIRTELAAKFDILFEEKRKENIKIRSEKPNSKITDINAKSEAVKAAIGEDEKSVKALERLYKETKKEKKSKSRIITLENKIESKKQKIQTRLRELEQLKTNKDALEHQISEIELDEKEKFHLALPNVKSETKIELSGWLVETFYRARILVNGSKEHYGDVRWSSYSGQGTWGRCSECSVALVEGSVCSCGNLMCNNHLAYCKLCLEPACSEHRAHCGICNAIFCSAHSATCEVCKTVACTSHSAVCSICSRKICIDCSKRKGVFKREVFCVDCSTK